MVLRALFDTNESQGKEVGGKLELIVLNTSEALMGSAYSSITSTNRIPRVVQH